MKKTISLTRLLTIGYFALLVVLLIGVLVYLSIAPDFVRPISFTVDAASYDYSIDEFAEYLQETGYMAPSGYYDCEITLGGVESVRLYGDTFVLKWDPAVMESAHPSHDLWKQASSVGSLQLSDGMRLVNYGLFAVSYREKAGDEVHEPYECLNDFPTAYSGCHSLYSVWDYSIEDLLDYFVQCGFFEQSDIGNMAELGTENYLANSIDMAWFDVDHLVEGTEAYKYWYQMQNDGYIFLYEQMIYVPAMNGPFAVYVNSPSTAHAEDVYAALARFPLDYDGEPSLLKED